MTSSKHNLTGPARQSRVVTAPLKPSPRLVKPSNLIVIRRQGRRHNPVRQHVGETLEPLTSGALNSAPTPPTAWFHTITGTDGNATDSIEPLILVSGPLPIDTVWTLPPRTRRRRDEDEQPVLAGPHHNDERSIPGCLRFARSRLENLT